MKKVLLLALLLFAVPAFAQHAGIAPKAGASLTSGTSANGPQGPAGPVAGANTQVVFNDGGAAAGNAGFTFNKTTATLTLTGLVIGTGMKYTTGSRPTCDATIRGTVWYVAGAAGVKDTFEVCGKDTNNAYAWRTIY